MSEREQSEQRRSESKPEDEAVEHFRQMVEHWKAILRDEKCPIGAKLQIFKSIADGGQESYHCLLLDHAFGGGR